MRRFFTRIHVEEYRKSVMETLVSHLHAMETQLQKIHPN